MFASKSVKKKIIITKNYTKSRDEAAKSMQTKGVGILHLVNCTAENFHQEKFSPNLILYSVYIDEAFDKFSGGANISPTKI